MSKLLLICLVAFGILQNITADDGQWVKSEDEVFLTPREFPCPAASLIAPCECEFTNERLYLDCTNVTSEVEIYNLFQQDFAVKEFYEFRMSSNQFVQRLDVNTNGVSFERIILFPGPFNIFGVAENFLSSSYNTLEDFYIQNSPLTYKTVPFGYLNTLPNLHRLFLEANQINEVPRFNSTSLRSLRITMSNISSLALGTFAAPTYLYDLELNFNHITRIVVNLFPIFFETVRIRLDFNEIQSIGRRAFYDATNNRTAGLSYLYLSNNQLTQLGIESIPLTKTSRLITLENNQISDIAFDAFYLLSEPKLNNIELLFGNNQLNVIEEFKWGGIMKYLSLLDLKDNPLTCGCDINWIVQSTYYMSKISADSKCIDGQAIIDLDPAIYMNVCGGATTTATP